MRQTVRACYNVLNSMFVYHSVYIILYVYQHVSILSI